MYKKQLQELAQRSCFNLPAYTCQREGPDHAPRFKAAVNFNGEQFESPGFFTTLRQAEHAAAEVALAALARRGPSNSAARIQLRRPTPPSNSRSSSSSSRSRPRAQQQPLFPGTFAAYDMEPIVSANLPPGFDTSTRRRVYVGNINLQVTDAILQEVFQSIGPVEGCKLIRKEKSSFGFVDYYDRRSAALAILSLNGRQLYGQPIKVNWAYTSTQREDPSGHFNIFVGDLCPEVTDATLFAFFSGYSTCSDARVMWDQKTGRSRGFGFVSFRNQQDAQSAINDLNGKWLGNRQIRCNWATKGAIAGEEKQIVDSKVDMTNGTSESGKENPNEDSPESNPQFTTVYVGNLPHEATNNDVHLFFHSLGAGSIEEVRVTRDKGFGFVRYSTHEEAALAIQMGNGQLIGGRQIKVSLRHEKEVHPNRPTLRIVVTDKRDLKSHVKDMHDNREYRYTIDGVVDEPVKATVFPCLFTQYMKVADLVGHEETVNELLKIITEGTEMSVADGKIVSIVGLGGLGKTTLAHAIYRKLKAQFDCWAYVSVSRNPDMKKLFKCMLYQLGKKNNANIHEGILDERQLIYELNEFLQKRRYFIVIDDIRDILVWNMIKCALPTNDGGFIIIATTCILDVAKQVGGTYMMRPLCLQNSRILLHRKTFGVEDKDEYADEELTEISEKILQKCGGVPLAIITISGLLASKRENKIEWYKFYNSIDSVVKNSLDVESMKNILSLNYSDLPSHLRTCLLYLSLFPEGHDIDKNRLIRLWIAEGLIQCGKQEESPFELGESYFYELINRSMIQPVYKRWYYDMTECCQVHDMVLDLILYLSGKEKLVSIWDHMHDTLHSKEIQWLSLQNSMVDIATHEAAVNMQEVRSVIVFPSAVKLLPALACFKVLRVLDLQSCCLSQGCSLKYLGNLFHLKYLGLRGTGIASLSEEIGKLQFLQTLDVTGNEISSLPFTVAELKHLMCLHIDSRTGAPNGIGSFTSLEELSTLRIQDSTDIIQKLGNQTELRVLGIDCRTGWNVNRVERSLVDCLHKLQNIKTLSISMVGECNLDAWVAPRYLRRLELTGCWPSPVPALLNNTSLLLELYFLSIEVRKLRQEDLESLGKLPALSYLDIEVGNQSLGTVQTFLIGPSSFPCLVHCTLRGYIGPVVFQQGAMPEVARLHLVFPVREIREAAGTNRGGFDDLGFRNLPRLRDVSFLLRRGGASMGEVEEAEAALRRTIERHPNHPTLEIL